MQSAVKKVDGAFLVSQVCQVPRMPGPGGRFQQILIPVDLKNDICKIARQLRANLLILSTPNARWFEDGVFGSQPERILDSAPCPVLVLRQKEIDSSAAKPRRVAR